MKNLQKPNKEINKNRKSKIKRTVLITTASVLTAITVFGFASGSFITNNDSLPTKEQIYKNIMMLDPDIHYISLTGDGLIKSFTRYVPNKNKTSFIVLDKNITESQKICIEDFIKDLNYLFEYINPNYKFEVTSDYTLFTRLNSNIIYVKNSETVKNSESFDAKHTAQYIPTSNQLKTCFNTICLSDNKDYSSKTSDGTSTFVHEFCHVLGLDDCYDKTFFYTSIMNTTDFSPDKYFAFNDLMAIGCLYGKYNNLKEANDFITFTCNYLELNPEHYLINERSGTFFKTTLPTLPNLYKDKLPILPNLDDENLH